MSYQDHDPPEEPQLHTQTLSPVSPKPVAFPQPSNIPILQNQMDSTMSESSTYPGVAQQAQTEQGTLEQQPEDLAAQQTAQAMPVLVEDDSGVEAATQAGQANAATLEEGGEDNTSGAMSELRETENATEDDQEAVHNGDDTLNTDAANAEFGHAESEPEAAQQNALDIQALLDNIVNTAAASASNASPQRSTSTLPPRPPAQSNGTTQASTYQGPPGTNIPHLGILPPPGIGAPPGTSASTSSLPPPPLASFQQRSPTLAQSGEQKSGAPDKQRGGSAEHYTDDDKDDVDRRWGPDVQRKYDEFIEQERIYVKDGKWEDFPLMSRMFIGNLPTEKVTKRDLFHVFHKHGPLAQVSIKQAYGFVQFLTAQDCLRALDAEQGVAIRGRKIHLEISKPQRSKNQGRDNRQRRSRSPENRGIDRYRSGDNRRQRSPSPRSRGRMGMGRRRSRSRSPPYGNGRMGRSSDLDDDCPLPRRAPQDVPDIQIIAKDSPDRNFISYVERAFDQRGIKSNVLLLSPRLPEPSVMRRQIIEGVLAVMKLDREVQMRNKYALSVFDRSQGANNVRFEEYADLDLNICVELVLRAKRTAKPPMPQYGAPTTGPYGLPIVSPQQPSYAPPPQQQQPPQQQYYNQAPAPQPPTPQFPNLDPNSIQSLLSRVQQTPQQHNPQPYGAPPPPSPMNQAPDIARLLASAGIAGPSAQQPYPTQQQMNSLPPNIQALLGSVQQQQQQPPPQQQQGGYAGYQQSPPQQYQQPPPQQQQGYGGQQQQGGPDMKNIMAGLARWKG